MRHVELALGVSLIDKQRHEPLDRTFHPKRQGDVAETDDFERKKA